MGYEEYLNITVLQENKPVTYKSMARSLGIHVNKAKQALYEFSKQHSNVHAVYCLTGTTLDNQFKIQLVKDADVEEAQKKYKKLTGVHVYSLCSFVPTDFSVFYAACKDAPKLTMEDRIKCGILRNPTVHLEQGNKQQQSSHIPPKPSIPASPKTLTNQSVSTTNKSKTTPLGTKRKGTLNFGPSTTTKKQAVTTNAPKENPVAKPSPITLSSSLTKGSATTNERKPTAKTDEIEKRMAKTSLKASDIFSSDEEDDNPAAIETRIPIQDAPNEDEDDDVEMVDIEDSKDKDDKNEEITNFMDEDEDEKDNAASTPTTTPGKTRRKVLKKKTYKNARGLLVTENVWEWEEVNDEETTEKKPTPSKSVKDASAAPSSANKAGAAKKPVKKPAAQSNLFNFFKKT